ncbi:MAG: aldehyde dehydrogenase family protein, partial [Solirubrobacterales bacterium]
TVVVDVPGDAALMTEETFGPVAPIVPVSSLDEAIERANSLRYGLGAIIYTRDLANAVKCLKEVRAGSVWINDPLTDNDAGPFGGFKNSGIGRELGAEGLDAFREAKHVHIETEIEVKDWWFPYG